MLPFPLQSLYRGRQHSDVKTLKEPLFSAMESSNNYTPIKHKNKYYVRYEVLNIEEDQTHEFKGHRNISVHEVPPWCINTQENTRTRNAISRNLCGFLNSGFGGTVYVGVQDDGTVAGVRVTQYQQDHLLLSLQDAMNAFRPPVPSFMYNAKFVPVLDPGDDYPHQLQVHIYKILKFLQKSILSLPVPEDVRQQPHYLRSHLFCWCDYDALGRYKNGIIPMSYVVEISVIPLDCNNPQVQVLTPNSKIPMSPIFQCEDGQIYFRKHSTVAKYSLRDVEEHARTEVWLYKMPQLMEAWKELVTYKTLRQLVDKAMVQQKDKVCTENHPGVTM